MALTLSGVPTCHPRPRASQDMNDAQHRGWDCKESLLLSSLQTCLSLFYMGHAVLQENEAVSKHPFSFLKCAPSSRP